MSTSSDSIQPAKLDEHQERVEGDTNLSPLRQSYQQACLDEATHQLLAEDAEYFLHQSLSTPCLDALVECEGVYLHDVSGRKLMDFHGNGVHHVGFRNEYVISAVKEQLEQMPFCTRRYTNDRAVALARKNARNHPGESRQSSFCAGWHERHWNGDEAVEIGDATVQNDLDVGIVSRGVD
jgi:4-aminobutyrate aminotransferase